MLNSYQSGDILCDSHTARTGNYRVLCYNFIIHHPSGALLLRLCLCGSWVRGPENVSASMRARL